MPTLSQQEAAILEAARAYARAVEAEDAARAADDIPSLNAAIRQLSAAELSVRRAVRGYGL